MLGQLKDIVERSGLDPMYKSLVIECVESAYRAGQQDACGRFMEVQREIYSEMVKSSNENEKEKNKK